MKLYDLAGAEEDLRFSPNCWRIKMALEHKGLVAETIPWRFVEKDVIAFSGQKAVPVLVDGDTTVSDSWEIAKYLETAYPDRPSLFGGPAGEGLALFVKFWCEQTLNRIVIRIILRDLFRCLHEKDKAYFRQSREARFGTTLEEYALPSEEGVRLLRDALTLCDCPFSASRISPERSPLSLTTSFLARSSGRGRYGPWLYSNRLIQFSGGVKRYWMPSEVLLALLGSAVDDLASLTQCSR